MEMTTMKVNKLPAITWHWVHMNDSELKIALPDKAPCMSLGGSCDGLGWTAGIASCGDEGSGRGNDGSGWSDTETGMGEEFARLMRTTQDALLEIPDGYKNDEASVITVNPQDGIGAGQLWIHAGSESASSLVIAICSDSVLAEDDKLNDSDAENAELKNSQGSSDASSDTTALQLEIHADAGASLKLYVAQILPRRGLSCLNIGGVCAERSCVELTELVLGTQQAYTGIVMKLEGDQSTFTGDLGYRVKPGQRVDINYISRHYGRQSVSHLNGWGVMEEDSFKLFRGTLDFHEGCPESVGSEKEDVLLLGDRQINQTIPLILCHEENVEGDHGATISRLDDQVLFYLGSRGVDPVTAENMIAEARLEALCSRIPDEKTRKEAESMIKSDGYTSVLTDFETDFEDETDEEN